MRTKKRMKRGVSLPLKIWYMKLSCNTDTKIFHKSIYDTFIPLLVGAINKFPATGNAVTRQSAKHAYEVL